MDPEAYPASPALRHRTPWHNDEVLELVRAVTRDDRLRAPTRLDDEIVAQFARRFGRTVSAVRWAESQILTGHVIGGDGSRKNQLQRQIVKALAWIELERVLWGRE